MENETTVQARLAAAQLEYKKITATHEVKAKSFSYKYASLDDVMMATRPALSKHGLSVSQSIEVMGTLLVCETTIFGPDGCFIKGNACVPMPSGSAQDYGSSISYARRYSYQAVAGISVGDEDTDGPAPEEQERKQDQGETVKKQSLTIALAQMATGAGLITGAGKTRDASKFMDLVKKTTPELFFPEGEQKPGRIVNWAIMTEDQYNKLVNAVNKTFMPNPPQADDEELF